MLQRKYLHRGGQSHCESTPSPTFQFFCVCFSLYIDAIDSSHKQALPKWQGKWLVQPRALSLHLIIQKKSQCHLREITWKDSDDLCLDLMPTIWILNWTQKEGVPVHMPCSCSQRAGRAPRWTTLSLPPNTHENCPNGTPQWTEG